MSVLALDHVNIRTTDLERTIAFFRDVLLMRVEAPRGGSIDKGAWIYDANGAAIVHLAKASIPYPSDGSSSFKALPGSGSLHHVALRCSGLDETVARIRARGLSFHENDMPEHKVRQVFVREPNEILFELNFSGDAYGKTPMAGSSNT